MSGLQGAESSAKKLVYFRTVLLGDGTQSTIALSRC